MCADGETPDPSLLRAQNAFDGLSAGVTGLLVGVVA